MSNKNGFVPRIETLDQRVSSLISSIFASNSLEKSIRSNPIEDEYSTKTLFDSLFKDITFAYSKYNSALLIEDDKKSKRELHSECSRYIVDANILLSTLSTRHPDLNSNKQFAELRKIVNDLRESCCKKLSDVKSPSKSSIPFEQE